MNCICAPMWVSSDRIHRPSAKSNEIKMIRLCAHKSSKHSALAQIHCVTFLSRDWFLSLMWALFIYIARIRIHIYVYVANIFAILTLTAYINAPQWTVSNEHYLFTNVAYRFVCSFIRLFVYSFDAIDMEMNVRINLHFAINNRHISSLFTKSIQFLMPNRFVFRVDNICSIKSNNYACCRLKNYQDPKIQCNQYHQTFID